MRKISLFAAFLLSLSFVAPPEKKITIWMIGDSTMAIKDPKAWPETGWGVPFATFFDTTITVSNHARNGRSTKTFIQEGLWQKVIDNVKPGDYVFIQFGHNDEVPTKASATKPEEFKNNLLRYIKETKQKKAKPVLLTPVARRKFDENGQITGTHDQYAEIVRTVAREMKLPWIDMDKKSQAILQRYGAEESKKLYLWASPGEYPNYPQGKQDDTHFNERGAQEMAQLVLGEIKTLLPELAAHIRRKIVVASDGSGDFTTLQDAFNSIPAGNTTPITVFVKSGTYKEKLVLDLGKAFVTLQGENKWNTIITYDDHTGKISPKGDTINTRTSQSFWMRADNFTAENISFENTAGMNAGQAVAVQVSGDKAVFRNCRFLGHQDVLYTIHPNSRQYYEDCYIEGTTDFIFGASTVWFQRCHIHSKRNSHITAASTPQNHAYGYIFNECIFTADSAVTRVTLGRPWRPYSSVTYIDCYLDRHIIRAGWDNWRNPENEKTARYAEYNSFGPGANPSARVAWSRQLGTEERNRITISNVFGDWLPPQKKF